MRIGQVGRTMQLVIIEDSPLRAADPRTKLFVSVAVSFIVMMPLKRLVIFLVGYCFFLLWGKLLVSAAKQLWRLKWFLLLLFFLDWWLIDLSHAAIICARLILITGVFTLFFSTTTTRELGLALEKLRIPYRYAFSLSLAFQSLGYLDDEWRSIREAQASRGAIKNTSSLKRTLAQLRNLVALTIPAIVLTTKRAWANTEAAYARGFDSPKRKSYYTLSFKGLDGILFAGTILVLLATFWRY